MIHSARPIVPPVATTILTWKLFCFARFWKVGTYGRADNKSKNSDHYRLWLWVGLVDNLSIGQFIPEEAAKVFIHQASANRSLHFHIVSVRPSIQIKPRYSSKTKQAAPLKQNKVTWQATYGLVDH